MRIVPFIIVIFLLVTSLGHAEEQSEDWASVLGSNEFGATQESEVLGMTADELANYQEAEDSGEGDDEIPDVFVRNRRRFVMREMKFNSDWDCDPTAVPAMVDQFKVQTGMKAKALLPRTPLTFDSDELMDFPFVYMTAHYAFEFSDAELEGLRKYIKNGGFVLADDCLYGQTFGPAFEGEISRLFEGNELKTIDVDHPIHGMVYKQKFTWGQTHESGLPRLFMNANPFSGFVYDGRLAVVYTPQDFGCHWEISSPATPSNPLGRGMHGLDKYQTRPHSYKIGINLILFSFLH